MTLAMITIAEMTTVPKIRIVYATIIVVVTITLANDNDTPTATPKINTNPVQH